ncbi:MAG: HlyD family efflux transporter periplasmic adaptor subunit [Pseudomonadota bacterium]
MDEIIDTKPKRFGGPRALALGVAILALALIGLVFSMEKAVPSVDAARLVIAQVERSDFANEVSAFGKLAAKRTLLLSAPESARVEDVLLQPGALVAEGDLIMRLSSNDVDSALSEADVAVAVARADEAAARARHRKEERQVMSELGKAELEAKSIALERDAELQLLESQAISKVAAKRTELRYELSLAVQKQLADELDQIKDSNRIEAEALEMKLHNLAQVAESRRMRQRALAIRAGFDGIVAVVSATPGQVVAGGASLGVLIDPSALHARLQVAERQARLLKIGQRVTITTPNGRLEAKIVRIDPTVTQGQVVADAEFIGAIPPGLRQDLAVDARINLDRINAALVVAKPSGLSAPGRLRVFVVTGNRARARDVLFGPVSPDRAVVLDGLKAGERIVVSDIGQWKDQQNIDIR